MAREAAQERTRRIRGSGQIQHCKTCEETFYVPGWQLRRGIVKYCQRTCRDYRADAAGFIPRLLKARKHKRTKLEDAGACLLRRIGILFEEEQVMFERFTADVLIRDRRLVIYWDGDFWHGNPTVHPNLHPIQQANVKRDEIHNALLQKDGYRVLRFWETDVYSRPDWVCSEVLRALANSSNT